MQLRTSRTKSLQNWRTVRSWQKMVLRKSVNKKCWKRGYWTSALCWKHAEDPCKLIELEDCPRTNKLQIEKTEEIENETWNDCNGRGTEISLNIFVCLSKLLIEFPSHCFFLIQSALRINMKPLFRWLLVLTN